MLTDMPRIVFLHIPKTGGTTVDQLLRCHYTADEICPDRLGNIGLWPPERLSKFRFFSAHDTFYNLRCIAPPMRMITFLREPIDRSISNYVYLRSYATNFIESNNIPYPRLAKTYDFKSFLKCPIPKMYRNLANIMTRALSDPIFNADGKLWRSDEEMLDAALTNLDQIDVCGINEYFPESIDLICHTLDLAPPATIAAANKTRDNHLTNSVAFEPSEYVEIDDETEELLINLNRLDAVLYEEGKARFLAKIGSRPRRLSGFHNGVGRIIRQYSRTVAHAKQGEVGFVQFGPHLRLKAGRYRVTLDMGYRADSPPPDAAVLVTVDVCSHLGESIHFRRELSSGDLRVDDFGTLPIDFVLERTVSDLEIRVYQPGACDLFVDMTPTIEILG